MLPKTFSREGVEISDPVEIVEHFNDYFVNVSPNLAKTLEQPKLLSNHLCYETMKKAFFTTRHVRRKLRRFERRLLKIDPSKSTGFDDLNPKVIHQIAL